MIPTAAGPCLESGGECRPVAGDLPVGRLVRIRGKRVRRRIIPSEVEVREPDPAGVRDRLTRFRAGIGG